ncbi:MAG: hypothetical protein KA239_09415 [Bacteroidia bacterium]|nr:hypothetical protein [Bacteroidia bacterium]
MTSLEMRRFATQELLKGNSYEAVYTDLAGRIHGRELEASTSAGIMKPWVKMAYAATNKPLSGWIRAVQARFSFEDFGESH